MRDVYRSLLTVLAAVLGLWLVLGFWPLSVSSQVALSLLIVLVCGVVLWRQWRVAHRDSLAMPVDALLPPEDFQGAVVLVVGDNAALFTGDILHRETRQGWYLRVKEAGQLPLLIQQLVTVRPALASQVSVLLAVMPEQHVSAEDFTQVLRGWQRAIVQCRSWLGGLPPLWSVCWVSPPESASQEPPAWFVTTDPRQGMQAHQPGQGHIPLAAWLEQSGTGGRFTRLSQSLWLEALTGWYRPAVESLLASRQGELPSLPPCAQGMCLVPVRGMPGNLWQQHVAGLTAFSPPQLLPSDELPLPELLLSALPRRRGLSRRMRFWRGAGLLTGGFLLLAMLASFVNNQRLVRSVSDHLTLYRHLSGEPAAPKLQVQERLRADGRRLDEMARRGEPLRYRLGLYQGLRLIPPVEAAVNDWAPPPPPAPVIKKIVQGPKTVRLDSMSLFDSGKSDLKPGSTKMLVNSLVGIKAKPGWLIVVSGHTDNTGNPKLNQTLSLKRAEAVRDWMRDTGDVPVSCFAVQGYGESRPIATNDTPEGRAQNRRVEISLVPQADACQLPGHALASSQDDDASLHEGE